MGKIIVSDFNLGKTLDSGQIFRYGKDLVWYYIISRNKVFKVRQTGNVLEFKGATKKFIENYFSLDFDFRTVSSYLSAEKQLSSAFRLHKGIRIAKQDPWECAVSFVCSSASNIPRIKGCLNALAEQFGEKVVFDGETFYAFPEPGSINNSKKLAACRLGFRAKYVFELNKLADDKFFQKLRKMDYSSAKEKLVELPGIGDKIADCVLLFSLGFHEAFPVDVWIKRAMEELYFGKKESSYKKIGEFAREHFGTYAGYAQQYLYHWRRMNG